MRLTACIATVIFCSLTPAERSGAYGHRVVHAQPKLFGDRSKGGAMYVGKSVEFRAGVTATGNSAKEGGVFFVDE